MNTKLPNNWQWVKLGEVCEFEYGSGLPAKKRNKGRIPVYGSNGIVGYHDRHLIEGPSIIIGRKGSIGEVHLALESCWPIDTTYFVNSLNINKDIDIFWFVYCLRTLNMQNLNKAAAVPGLNRNDAYKIKIPLPPLPEQRRIAAILDKADNLRRKRRQTIELCDQFLRSTFLDMFGDPVTNPKGWEVKELRSVIDAVVSGWSAKGEQKVRMKDDWAVLKISAVTSGYYQPVECKVVSESIAIQKKIISPKKGDLLFSRANTRELVAATCLVDANDRKLFLPDKLWSIVPVPQKSCTEYLKYLLSHPKFREKITKKATGTSGSMLNVSKEKVLKTEAPIPPMLLQNKFAGIVWQTYRIREEFLSGSSINENLFNSLVQRAFRGKL